jgi:hypothetical protein
VLDEKILTNGDHSPATLEVTNDLRDRFLGAIKEDLSDPNQRDRNLVIFVFGHGRKDHGIGIGEGLIEIKTLASLLPDGCKVSFFTTACYSIGGGQPQNSWTSPQPTQRQVIQHHILDQVVRAASMVLVGSRRWSRLYANARKT